MSLKSTLLENKKTALGAVFLSCAPLLFSSLVTAFLISNLEFLKTLSFVQWWQVFGVSILTMSLALTPSTFVAIVGGFFLGWLSAPLMIVAYLAASSLGYVLGRLLDGGHLMIMIQKHPKVAGALKELKEKDSTLMILVRLSPVLPFALMNLLMPALRVTFPVFLVAGALGMLPRTLFSIWVGSQARDLMTVLGGKASDTATSVVVIALTVISVGGLLYLFLKAVKRSVTQT